MSYYKQLDLPVMADLVYPATEKHIEVTLRKTNWMWKTYHVYIIFLGKPWVFPHLCAFICMCIYICYTYFSKFKREFKIHIVMILWRLPSRISPFWCFHQFQPEDHTILVTPLISQQKGPSTYVFLVYKHKNSWVSYKTNIIFGCS